MLLMVINNEILTALIHCNYKAHLKGQNLQCAKSDFEIVFNELNEIQKQRYCANNSINNEFKSQSYTIYNQYELNKIYTNTTFKNDGVIILIDGCRFTEKNKILPILITPFEKVSKADRLFIALQSYFIEREFSLKIDYAEIVFGQQLNQ